MIDIIIDGLIGEIISRGIEASKNVIKDIVEKKENKGIHAKIYRVIINALNAIACEGYKNNWDKIYETVEVLIKLFKNTKEYSIERIKPCLKNVCPEANIYTCVWFEDLLYKEISKKENIELFHEILLRMVEQGDKYSREELREIKETLYQVCEDLKELSKNTDSLNMGIQNNVKSMGTQNNVKSRTGEYEKKWNDNMFLNDFDKRDEKAGVNVTLREVYLEEHLPRYIWGDNKNESGDLKEVLSEYLDAKNENRMLLILGQPGIGKSTLITWIIANFQNRRDDILVYRFASDLKNIEWKKSNLSHDILDALNLSYYDLNGKILILDGFDEINIESNRIGVLDSLYGDLVYGKNNENFTLIITCREHYIQGFERGKCRYITLQPWNTEQIKSFCTVFQNKTNSNISEHTMEKILENRKILGLPLILYMMLALNISIEKEGSIVDVYDRIFSLKGGIYDRCIDNKRFDNFHRIGEIKKIVHQISREIAMWMFENEFEEEFIPKDEYEKICINLIRKQSSRSMDIKHDFLIGNYFRMVNYCEGVGSERLYFVHRSILEYFVADTIYTSIVRSVKISKEELARIFGTLLRKNKLSREILEYLRYKISNSELMEAFDTVKDTFQLMLQDGMTYFTKEKCKNIITCEMLVFKNMLEVLHLWGDCHIQFDSSIVNYLKYNNQRINLRKVNMSNLKLDSINLNDVYLSDTDLAGACLVNAHLSNADLKGANLRRAELINADLKGAKLNSACLIDAVLCGADLGNAMLSQVDLSNANLSNADLSKAGLSYAVLNGADLGNANLSNANLSNADLSNTNLCSADLSNARLMGAKLYQADLTGVILTGANLELSFWEKDVIPFVIPQLKKAQFRHIIIQDEYETKKIHRIQLFLLKNKLF